LKDKNKVEGGEDEEVYIGDGGIGGNNWKVEEDRMIKRKG
jgi:hypothetical protein